MRKWSVRKLRRRPRSCDSNKRRSNEKRARSASSKLKVVEDEEHIEKSNSTPSISAEVKEKQESEASEKDNVTVTTDILLFGSDFDKQPLADSIDLSSDQDSTGGEDNDIMGILLLKKFVIKNRLILKKFQWTKRIYRNCMRTCYYTKRLRHTTFQ